jgi:hypothetical protein
MPIMVITNLDYLIDELRLHLGDTDPAAYRYTDPWLRTALVMGVKGLQRWWNYKYLIASGGTYNAYRNPNTVFLFADPPLIQDGDERPIILMASILIKGGSLQANAWNVGSWRDAEIAYSNIEQGRLQQASVAGDKAELESYLKPPVKRLVWPGKQSLPGFKQNLFENTQDEHDAES